MPDGTERIGVADAALLVAVAALWGGNFVVAKVGLAHLPPLLFTALRFAVCALPVLWLPRPDVGWRLLVALGLILGAAVFGFLFAGIAAGVNPGLASLVMQTHVLFTAVLTVVVTGRSLPFYRWTAVAIGFAGIGLLVRQGMTVGSGAGLALVLAGALSWGIANLLFAKVPPASMLGVMVWMSLVPLIPLFVLSLVIEGEAAVSASLRDFDAAALGAVLYTSVVSTLLCYGAWGAMIRKYGAAEVAPFALLVPVFAMAGAALFLRAPIESSVLQAALLIGSALVLNVWGRFFAAGLSQAMRPRPNHRS